MSNPEWDNYTNDLGVYVAKIKLTTLEDLLKLGVHVSPHMLGELVKELKARITKLESQR